MVLSAYGMQPLIGNFTGRFRWIRFLNFSDLDILNSYSLVFIA